MGTRCLTFVYNDNKQPILNLYRQYDGYPEGHGQELGEFLKGLEITNGISMQTKEKRTANGMGCLAAQLVAHFKNSVGGFYIHSIESKDCGQEYEYHVYDNSITVIKNCDDKIIYQGNWKNFSETDFSSVH